LTPTIPNDCPSIFREVMQMCWKKDPDQRPVSFTFFGIPLSFPTNDKLQTISDVCFALFFFDLNDY
jgi:hypothetical protein